MKSYATIIAVVALQGAMAAPQSSGRPLAPERGPPLPSNHVVNTAVPSLVNSACYQNSTGQRDGAGLIKYPCISEQEIVSYCHAQYSKDIEGIKSCLFNDGSTYEADHVCCISCRNLNGDGSEGIKDDAVKFMADLKERFVKNNRDNRKFADVARDLRKGIKLVSLPAKAERDPQGVTDINILSYCPNPKLPQQAGSPRAAAPVKPAPPSASPIAAVTNSSRLAGQVDVEPKFKKVEIEIGFTGSFTGRMEAHAAANASANQNNTALMLVEMTAKFELNICENCAAPNQSEASRRKTVRASLSSSNMELITLQPRPETCQKASKVVSSAVRDLNNCSCLPSDVDNVSPVSPDAIGEGSVMSSKGQFVPLRLSEGHNEVLSNAPEMHSAQQTRPGGKTGISSEKCKGQSRPDSPPGPYCE